MTFSDAQLELLIEALASFKADTLHTVSLRRSSNQPPSVFLREQLMLMERTTQQLVEEVGTRESRRWG